MFRDAEKKERDLEFDTYIYNGDLKKSIYMTNGDLKKGRLLVVFRL